MPITPLYNMPHPRFHNGRVDFMPAPPLGIPPPLDDPHPHHGLGSSILLTLSTHDPLVDLPPLHAPKTLHYLGGGVPAHAHGA